MVSQGELRRTWSVYSS